MLKRKLIRDIKSNKMQFITIFLMVLIGIMVYTGIEGYMLGMEESANNYYQKNNLQDLDAFGKLNKNTLNEIKKIDEVKDAEGKLTFVGNLDSKKGHKLELNFIESNNISKFHIVEGKDFKNEKNTIYLDSYYAKNNNIKVGDTLEVSYNLLELKLKVEALIMVPDHVYAVKDETEVFPTHTDYGYAYLSTLNITEKFIKSEIIKEKKITEKQFDYLVPNFNYKDYIYYSSIMIDVLDNKNINNIKENVRKIETVNAVLNIKDEPSYYQYKREMEEGEGYIGIFSGLFIFIAVLSVITTMTRMIKKERSQIGTLKALGFSNIRVTIHYLSYIFYISLVGIICGFLSGYFGIGNLFMSMEMSRFEVPNYHTGISLSVIIVSIITVSLVLLATYLSIRKILKENTAETLRSEKPKEKNGNIHINFGNFSTKWNIRDILRNKIRTLMGLVGVTGCMILLVVAFGMLDTINNYMHIELDVINNYETRLNLDNSITEENLNKLYDEYGNNSSKTIGIEILKNDEVISNNILVHDAGNLIQVLDSNDKSFKLEDGIYVTRKFAEINDYKINDLIKWRIYGDEKIHQTKIKGFNKDPQNQNITMNKKTYEELGYNYKPDTIYIKDKLDSTIKITGVITIQDISSIKDGVLDMMSMMMKMIYILVIFAGVLGSIIIYNMGILSFAEKDYQFATLKVLGFKDKKISNLFIKQNIWITIIAIIISIPLGYYVTDYVFTSSLGDAYDFSVVISLKTYLIASIGTFTVSYLVSKFLSGKIKKIDMVKSLKGNE